MRLRLRKRPLGPELKTGLDEGLGDNAIIGKKQFLKEVRKLVVPHPSHVSHPRHPATSANHDSQPRQHTSPVTHSIHANRPGRQVEVVK